MKHARAVIFHLRGHEIKVTSLQRADIRKVETQAMHLDLSHLVICDADIKLAVPRSLAGFSCWPVCGNGIKTRNDPRH